VGTVSPGAQRTPYKGPCPDPECGGVLYGHFFSGERVPGILGYTLRKSLVRMRRNLMFGWRCESCGFTWFVTEAMRPKDGDQRPIRKDRVAAIRNLRRNGYRFFDWEKPHVPAE
jgi:hypothetical protein